LKNEKPLSVVFFGRRSPLSMKVLQAVAAKHRVVGVVDSQFRGFQEPSWWQRLLTPALRRENIAEFARSRGIPYLLLTRDRMSELDTFLALHKAEVGVVAKMAQLLPERIFQQFPRGVLNVHPSLLPNYRGPLAVFWAYYHQEPTIGLTVHFIDAGEDTGDIVKQKELTVGFGEDTRSLAARYADVAGDLVLEALEEVAGGAVSRRPQRHLPCPFRARFLKPGENPIDWEAWPIERIFHVLRGANGTMDLLPRRHFPLSLFEWDVSRYEKGEAQPARLGIRRAGLRHYVAVREGRIYLRPRFSAWQARCALREVLRGSRL
jgi:methionyl-tRNA formyltransferase